MEVCRDKMKGLYDAKNIVSYILYRYGTMDRKITNLRLHKILYYSQISYFREHGAALIEDDFYAWRQGPVIPSIYEYFKKYMCAEIDPEDKQVLDWWKYLQKDTIYVLDDLIYSTFNMDDWELVQKSKETIPWEYTYVPHEPRIITKENIFNYGEMNVP